ncbi:hypothetical protein [Brevundimonas aurifodinae]|uniref:M28 family peptidase n=1 Tax=Brevundimonas aurifodinae TaxID=1508312 RepID=A0ABV1NL27_9CAUL
MPFTVRQFLLDRAVLIADGHALEALPYWFPKATPGLLRRRLVADPGQARDAILLAQAPEGLAGLRALPGLVQSAAQAGAAGLVIVSSTPSGEYFGHGQGEACATPTLLVGSKDLSALQAAVASGQPIDMEIAGEVRNDAEGFNVVARVGTAGPVVGVSTPTSAWTTSAGERGPGVALWLMLLRRAAARPGRWTFVASSGHELRAAGGRAFAESGAGPKPEDTALWVHLGASIATRRFERDALGRFSPTDQPGRGARLLTNQTAWLAPLTTAFGERTPFTPVLATAATARGELQLYFGEGYRAVGFEGSHDFFHAPGDLPNVTSPALLEAVGLSLIQFIDGVV